MENLTQQIHKFVLSLLKCGKKVKVQILSWIGDCLQANADRGKIWNSQMPELNLSNSKVVSDGFMLNLGCVLTRLCQPFCTPDNHNKVLKVDPTYCAVTVSVNLKEKKTNETN